MRISPLPSFTLARERFQSTPACSDRARLLFSDAPFPETLTGIAKRPAGLAEPRASVSETARLFARILPCGGGWRHRVGSSRRRASGASVAAVPQGEQS